VADVLLALGLMALLGSLLRYWLPDFDVEAARRSIGVLVLNVFLPALVFRVICSVPSGPEMVQIPLVMGIGVVCCLGLALLLFRPLVMPAEEKGALVLASAFGNVTYLGLPVLQGLFPGLSLQVAKVAILSEVTTTPPSISASVWPWARASGARCAAASGVRPCTRLSRCRRSGPSCWPLSGPAAAYQCRGF
jgi:predicted permease